MAGRFLVNLFLLLVFPLTGCSIVMALNGKPEPDFKAFDKGSSREVVEFQLGKPVSETAMAEGQKEVTYRYEMGNSSNAARASIYFYYDLIFIGIPEPIFTVVELIQGHDEESRITYDAQGRVVNIAGYKPPEPSAAEVAARQEQEKYVRKPPADPGRISQPTSGGIATQPVKSSGDVATQPASGGLSTQPGGSTTDISTQPGLQPPASNSKEGQPKITPVVSPTP